MCVMTLTAISSFQQDQCALPQVKCPKSSQIGPLTLSNLKVPNVLIIRHATRRRSASGYYTDRV